MEDTSTSPTTAAATTLLTVINPGGKVCTKAGQSHAKQRRCCKRGTRFCRTVSTGIIEQPNVLREPLPQIPQAKGNIGIGIGSASPDAALSFSGQSDQTIDMVRKTTVSGAGNSLTVQAGGAFVGSSNLNGGNLILVSGISNSKLRWLQVPNRKALVEADFLMKCQLGIQLRRERTEINEIV